MQIPKVVPTVPHVVALYLREPPSEREVVRVNRMAWRRHEIVSAVVDSGTSGLTQREMRERGLNFGSAGITYDLNELVKFGVLRSCWNDRIMDFRYHLAEPEEEMNF